jgi:hypothetical protein
MDDRPAAPNTPVQTSSAQLQSIAASHRSKREQNRVQRHVCANDRTQTDVIPSGGNDGLTGLELGYHCSAPLLSLPLPSRHQGMKFPKNSDGSQMLDTGLPWLMSYNLRGPAHRTWVTRYYLTASGNQITAYSPVPRLFPRRTSKTLSDTITKSHALEATFLS